MISGFGTACLPAVLSYDLRQTVEAGRPADIVVVACMLALEALLQQHEAGAAGR
jgi:hypothetical protein